VRLAWHLPMRALWMDDGKVAPAEAGWNRLQPHLIRSFLMSLLRISTLSLAMLGLNISANATAAEKMDTHDFAVQMVAMENICNRLYPGSNASIDNAVASDNTIDEADKAEIKKVKGNPAYDLAVKSAELQLDGPLLKEVSQDMCKGFNPK
jgi:hypothetical protein